MAYCYEGQSEGATGDVSLLGRKFATLISPELSAYSLPICCHLHICSSEIPAVPNATGVIYPTSN